jgi:hypothetical protein
VLHYTAKASVGGKIAQIGQRLVDAAAQRMANEFFSNFDAQLRLRHPPAAAGAEKVAVRPAAGGFWARLRRWIGRLVARSA